MASQSRHISIGIERPASEVYDYAVDPRHLPAWAAGIGSSIDLVNDEWVARSPMGTVTVLFAERNSLGVLDHVVTLPTGESFSNPMRVIPDGDDSEVIFTLRRWEGESDLEYESDAAAIATDLATLKRLLEGEWAG